MFCKFCGKKIERAGKACKYCGKTQGTLRSTDGYFGILEDENLSEIKKVLSEEEKNIKEDIVGTEKVACWAEQSGQQEHKMEELKSKIDDFEKKMKRMVINIVLIIWIFILLIFFFAVNNTKKIKKDTANLKNAVNEIKDDQQELKIENEELKKKIEKMGSE